MPTALTDITSNIYGLLKIVAPALLVIVGGFDLIKSMSSEDEGAIKKAQQKLVKKLIAAAAVFLLFVLVQFLVTLIANSTDGSNITTCLDYLLNGYNV